MQSCSRAGIFLAAALPCAIVATVTLTAQERADPRAAAKRASEYRLGLEPDVIFANVFGEVNQAARCGTEGLTPVQQAAADTRIDALRESGSLELARKIKVRIAYHVVYGDKDEGKLRKKQVKKQHKAMKKAFRKPKAGVEPDAKTASDPKIVLKFGGVDFTENDDWFRGCGGFAAEDEMKKATASDPDEFLNFWFCDPGGGLLGYAYLPVSGVEGTYLFGAVVLWSSTPKGPAAPFDEGHTGTHEVGHSLGLDHTFQGGCGGKGDKVDDTPSQKTPNFGCSAKRSCGSADPIENYMNYTDDACMTEFTFGQNTRMDEQIQAFLPWG